MGQIKEEAIGGFNTFLAEQKAMDDEATMSIYLFDDRYEPLIENANIQAVAPLTDETFVPRGMTSLYDAVGKTINDVGFTLRSLPAKKRPSKVVLVILTDGHENTSKEFTSDQVKEMTQRQTSTYDWQFLYLGVGAESFADAQRMGIRADTTVVYEDASLLATSGTRAMGQSVSSYRSTGKMTVDPN
jgi:hypothetical protein